MSFESQKFLSLKYNLSILSFATCAFEVYLKTFCLSQIHDYLLLCFLCVLYVMLTFSLTLHCELIFVCSVKRGPTLFFCIDMQVPPLFVEKKLSPLLKGSPD